MLRATTRTILIVIGLVWMCSATALANEPASVQIPLTAYEQLRTAGMRTPSAADTGYAIGNAQTQIETVERDDRFVATVTAHVSVRVLRNEWTLVPLLPSGTALVSATDGGDAVALVAGPGGLSLATDQAATHEVELVYEIEAQRFEAGMSIAIPLPRATATRVTARVPGTGLGLALVPGIGTHTVESNGVTELTSTVSDSTGVSLSWRRAIDGARYVSSRATYHGELRGDAVHFTADFGIELLDGGRVRVPLLPTDVALGSIEADGRDAAIAVEEDRFVVTLQGRGRHVVRATFDAAIVRENGLPGIELAIAAIPVSRFEITLPGDKELTVDPTAAVTRTTARGRTVASFLLAMSDHVSVKWPEAVPEAAAGQVEVRANAAVYHIAHAEEGVLQMRAVVVVEVTHGQSTEFALDVPDGVLVNTVHSAAGEVADWRLVGERGRVLNVFLDRAVEGEFTFEITYEQPIPTADPTRRLAFPILSVRDMHRQRGMVALLATRDLTLTPSDAANLTPVGENQLPATIRDGIDATVAHTFRYGDAPPRLSVATTTREREVGRFDADVDTLVSIGDVTIGGSATIAIHVKSGSVNELRVDLPAGVSFLDLSAPSIRQHRLETVGDHQVVHIEFTQEMEGDFRIQLSYERVSTAGDGSVQVPTPHVQGPEVEQGRIAIEALAAAQVEASLVEHLSPVETADLPEQLVMRTTNPILLAYKYTHVTPPPRLGLRITRHREIETQEATIDDARYHTLYTEDGLAVTTVRFTVRNQRKQFLRIALPPGSEVWTARVNGHPETPAMAASLNPRSPIVLLNIIHSTTAFPVELVYATHASSIGRFGRVHLALPRPDVIVTRSSWEVFLPPDSSYGEPDGDMVIVGRGRVVGRGEMGSVGASLEGLPIAVPAEGVRFAFEKLYAGAAAGPVEISIPYASGWGRAVGLGMSLLGTALFWLGLLGLGWVVAGRYLPSAALVGAAHRILGGGAASRGTVIALGSMAAVGAAALFATVGYLSTGALGPVILSCLFALGITAALLRDRIATLVARAKPADAQTAEPPPSE